VGVSEAFTVARGGFTALAGQVDHVARAAVSALRRELGALTTRVGALEGSDDSATTPSALVTGSVIRVFRTPLPDGTFLVAVRGSATNNKGSALAAGDDICTIPDDYRPAGTENVITLFNRSANTVAPANVLASGLIEAAGAPGSILNAHFFVLSGQWIAPA
jgi:hypothetical protein